MNLLGLLFFASIVFGAPGTGEVSDQLVIVEMQMVNGEVHQVSIPLSEIDSTDPLTLVDTSSELFICTFTWPIPNEGCTASAATCAQAKAAFETCMCDVGFTHYCPGDTGGPGQGPDGGGN